LIWIWFTRSLLNTICLWMWRFRLCRVYRHGGREVVDSDSIRTVMAALYKEALNNGAADGARFLAKTFEDWYGEEIESHMRQYGWEFMTDGGSRGQA